MFQDVSSELLRLGYGIRFCPAGQSMTPTIRDGEAVTVEPVRADEVKRGDILLYRAESGLIAHRVVKIERERRAAERRYILRGDASVTCDVPINAGQILGRIATVERDGRAIKLAGRRAMLRRKVRQAGARMNRWWQEKRKSGARPLTPSSITFDN